jgi:hypothetical protein
MGSMTWNHTVDTASMMMVAECPICYKVHGFVNPPHGTVAVVIDHQPPPGQCLMYVDGVIATVWTDRSEL